MSRVETLKQAAADWTDAVRDDLIATSLAIHADPETAYQEHRTVRRLMDLLERLVGQRGATDVAGLETAFRAATPGRGDGPRIAFLAEYDALPGVGHGCGHNIIGTSTVAAYAAVARLMSELSGEVVLLGSPAEEGAGGKVPMVERGVFDGLDAVLMMHPHASNIAGWGGLALVPLAVEFRGKAAHASSFPYEGINALDAVIQTFVGVGLLRQQLTSDARIHGIITNGGAKPSVIPDFAAALFYVRAAEEAYVEETTEKVRGCARGAAVATGAAVSFPDPGVYAYNSIKRNSVLNAVYGKNMRALGRELGELSPPSVNWASNDVGNVSQRVPISSAFFQIVPRGTPNHSLTFAEASASVVGHQALLDGAKAMAMTAIDLLATPALVEQAWADFHATPGRPPYGTDGAAAPGQGSPRSRAGV